MKLLFVWSGLNGYMGDCWRELDSRPGVELKIIVDLQNRYYGGGFAPNDVLRNLEWSDKCLEDRSQDYVFIVGWRNRLCREAASNMWGGAKKICCFDMPWEWRFRKIAARLLLRRYLRRFDAAFVPGAAAMPYARWLGFPKDRIFTGLYGTDTRRVGMCKGGAGFLFVGRDSPEKGVAVLRDAYQVYKRKGGTWSLKIVNGVSPEELGPIYASADCFVLPSLWEPWGVVLVEAAAAGLPIICTDKCGARHEVVRDNGIVVRSGDVEELSDAMLRVSGLDRKERDGCGSIGRVLASPYSCEAWADRVLTLCNSLKPESAFNHVAK